MPKRARAAGRAPEPLPVAGLEPEPATPARVARTLRELVEEGARLLPAGRARRRPRELLARYPARHELRLFGTRFFLGDYRYDDSVGFFVGYVAQGETPRATRVWPRVFYKDSSLLWRVATHLVRDGGSVWIGKGDARVEERDGWEYLDSAEETADLPYELARSLDELSRRGKKRRDDDAMALVVREAPPGRIRAYADFCAPRRRAAARGRENGGRPVARFLRRGDPASLRFARGYEPDLARGVIERWSAASAFFGGRVDKYRVLSSNGRVQYLFHSSPTHVWLGHPQRLTTELSSYGVRVHDVRADEDAFLPGWEYHEAGSSQIPAGFAGAPHPDNEDRADASAWLEALPIVQAFRGEVLARDRRRAARVRRA